MFAIFVFSLGATLLFSGVLQTSTLHFLANSFQAHCILLAYLLILLIKTQAKTNQLEQVECHICAEDSGALIYGSKKWSPN